ncbi:MAG: DUF6089 family protein [Flavobacteriales bacterium AspAUS03]
MIYLTLGPVMHAQMHEIEAFLVGGNYIVLNQPVFGILYRYNLNPKYSICLHLMGAGIWGTNREASEQYRKNREQSIQDHLGEASILFEFNDTHKTQSTFFIFAGIDLVDYQEKTYVLDYPKWRDANGMPIEPKSCTNFEKINISNDMVRLFYTIPFSIGYKYKFIYNYLIINYISIYTTSTGNIDYNVLNIRQIVEKGLDKESYQTEIRNQSPDFLNEKTFNNFCSKNWYVFI